MKLPPTERQFFNQHKIKPRFHLLVINFAVNAYILNKSKNFHLVNSFINSCQHIKTKSSCYYLKSICNALFKQKLSRRKYLIIIKAIPKVVFIILLLSQHGNGLS